MADRPAERHRRRRLPSPALTSTTTATDGGVSGTEGSHSSIARDDPQLAALLNTIPSSSRELMRRMDQQKDELRLLQEENTRLRAREVEVSALTLRLQQQFASTQSQVDRLKSQIRMELTNPVTEEQYHAIEALEESKRDLLDAVKLGIFQQLGSMRAAKDTAIRRATELSTEVSRLTRENKELQQRLTELDAVADAEKQTTRRQLMEAEKRGASVVELEGKLRDMESRLRAAHLDQEQFLSAKLTASVKTDEATRLAMRLREAEVDSERYKTTAECAEQKLDILKSEYYELKLKNSQRVMELEACLRASEEKIKTLADLELESELFISNLAQQSDGQMTLVQAAQGNNLSNYESWLALPRSRKVAHTLTVTKRCLQLENRLAALQHDAEFKDKQIARLQVSLEMAREALNNTNSPFAMVERTVDELTRENENLHGKLGVLADENELLRKRLEQRTADVQVLCRHRKELLRIQRVLRRLGLEEHVSRDPAGRQEMEVSQTQRQGASESNTNEQTQMQSQNLPLASFQTHQLGMSSSTVQPLASAGSGGKQISALMEESSGAGAFLPAAIHISS